MCVWCLDSATLIAGKINIQQLSIIYSVLGLDVDGTL
jgi:hypothetical protein